MSIDKDFEGRDQGDIKLLKHLLVVIDIDLPESDFWVSVLQGLKVGSNALAWVARIVLEVKNNWFAFRGSEDVVESRLGRQSLHSSWVDGNVNDFWNLDNRSLWLSLGRHNYFWGYGLFLIVFTARIAAFGGIGKQLCQSHFFFGLGNCGDETSESKFGEHFIDRN